MEMKEIIDKEPVEGDDSTEEKDLEVPKKDRKKLLLGIGISALVLGLVLSFSYSLFISYLTGIPEVVVPDILGLDEGDALTVLNTYKLNGIYVGEKFSDTISGNLILECLPEPGRRVKAGRSVRYVLSQGRGMVLLRDLKGLTEKQVKETMVSSSLKIDTIGGLYSAKYKQGYIVSQNPKGNEYVNFDSTVNVYISKGYPIQFELEEIPDNMAQLLIKINFKVMGEPGSRINVKIASVEDTEKLVIYNEDFYAGKNLFLELEENIGNRVEVYFNDILAKSQKVIF
jgi:hypothetical protein